MVQPCIWSISVLICCLRCLAQICARFAHMSNVSPSLSFGYANFILTKRYLQLTNICNAGTHAGSRNCKCSIFQVGNSVKGSVHVRSCSAAQRRSVSRGLMSCLWTLTCVSNRNLNDDLTKSIRLLNSLAIKLKAGRMAAGALNLASPEVKIHLDSAESSDPIDVEQKELHETNSLVEEFMLLANISVAQKIQETFPQTAVLRRHLPPPKTNFEKLQDILMKRKGLTLDVSSSGALAASLDKCVVSQVAIPISVIGMLTSMIGFGRTCV